MPANGRTFHIPMTIDYQLHLVGLVGQQEGGNGIPETFLEYMGAQPCLLCWLEKVGFKISSWNHIPKMCWGKGEFWGPFLEGISQIALCGCEDELLQRKLRPP